MTRIQSSCKLHLLHVRQLQNEYFHLQGRGEMKEVFSGVTRQFKLTKLNASTGYTVRLAAVNSVGRR